MGSDITFPNVALSRAAGSPSMEEPVTTYHPITVRKALARPPGLLPFRDPM
jgi:hypothetical protein